MSKDDNSNIVNAITTMNIRSRQQLQIMIMIKINETLIMIIAQYVKTAGANLPVGLTRRYGR